MLLREVTRLTDWIETADEYPEEEVTAVLGDIHAHASSLDREELVELHAAVGRLMEAVRSQEERYRMDVIGHAAPVPATMHEIAMRLDAMRWLHRAAAHLSRIHFHLVNAADAPHKPAQGEGRI